MTTLVASDLDRTLIYSPSALALDVPDHEAPTLVCVEVLAGRPHSFMTMSTSETLRRIDSAAVFVPTTTRTIEQYRRVRIPGIRPSYAITSNGGHILVDGHRDDDWQRTVLQAVSNTGTDLSEVLTELEAHVSPDWVDKKRVADDLFCYLVVRPEAMPVSFLDEWKQWCADHGWVVSMQGRKIYSIPGPLNKERALAEVARRTGADITLAAGDGLLDAGLLVAADSAIRPPHGELESLDWQHPTVDIASRTGVYAAEDIAEWFEKRIVV